MIVAHEQDCPRMCESEWETCGFHSYTHVCQCHAAEQLRELVEAIDRYRAVFEVPFDPALRRALKNKHAPLYDVVVRQEDASSLLDAALGPFRKEPPIAK